jgi:hypothetical protein
VHGINLQWNKGQIKQPTQIYLYILPSGNITDVLRSLGPANIKGTYCKKKTDAFRRCLYKLYMLIR